MKLSFWHITTLILVLLNVFLIFQKYESKKITDDLNDYLEQESGNISEREEIHKWYNMLAFQANGTLLDGNMEVLDLDSNTSILKDHFDSQGKWVFRFFNKTCLSCVEKNVELIRNYFNQNENPFCVITDFQDINQMKIFKTKSHFKCEIYSISNLFQFLPEENGIPYLIFINELGIITHCLVIEKETPDRLEDYLFFITSN